MAISDEGMEKLSEDLRKLAGEVLDAKASLDAIAVEYAYRVALLARAASGRHTTHGSATEACARAVNVSRQVLQEYSTVTTRWKPADIKKMLGRRDCRGRPVTLHHLLLIVRAPKALREELERLIGNGGDLRQLRAVAQKGERGGATADGPAAQAAASRGAFDYDAGRPGESG